MRGPKKELGLRGGHQGTIAKNANTKLILEPFYASNPQQTITDNNSAISLQVICLGQKIIPSSVPFYCSNQDKYKMD